ncbi:hypothetical protein PHET_12479 [Paragonimus heterotremus]|uniref:Uncharacterized protein n=1 Tax=Paragonimus heterotremus TaxID=100268 RepID=A0A8J4SXU2_9TREM|nr:hypothetical protein PHET_12479 [Paragonimus heterotremus]
MAKPPHLLVLRVVKILGEIYDVLDDPRNHLFEVMRMRWTGMGIIVRKLAILPILISLHHQLHVANVYNRVELAVLPDETEGDG